MALSAAALLPRCGVASRPAHSAPRPRRVGGLFAGFTRGDGFSSIRVALAEFGYVEGRDFILELRYAENVVDRLPALASELVRLQVDLIVTSGGDTPLRAAKEATSTIPIVFTGVSDPVGNGLVPSLVRPGGNVTGVAGLPEISGKGLEKLKSIVPGLRRVAGLYTPAGTANVAVFRAAESSARALDIQIVPVPVRVLDELVPGLENSARERPEALMNLLGASFYGPGLEHIGLVLDFAIRERLPQIYGDVLFVRAGGLMSLGANTANRWRLMAHLIDKIFKGANPGDLPVAENNVFDFALNLSMARKIGLTIPEAVMRQATEVIN